MASSIAVFSQDVLEAVCDALGDTGSGLTGTEIGKVLAQCNIHDPAPSYTKRVRLFEALNARQLSDQSGNCVVQFVQAAMAPARYVHAQPGHYASRREHLNRALAFRGLQVNERGEVARVEPARTVDEAHARASSLRVELQRRHVHGDVLRFCRAELLDQDYFHAVLEATKSVADKIRAKSGLVTDGSQLVDEAFNYSAPQLPRLAINTLRTPSEVNEHRGFMSLLKGMFQMFRNPTAHEPRIHRNIGEEEALDLLAVVSFLHRTLDRVIPTASGSSHP